MVLRGNSEIFSKRRTAIASRMRCGSYRWRLSATRARELAQLRVSQVVAFQSSWRNSFPVPFMLKFMLFGPDGASFLCQVFPACH